MEKNLSLSECAYSYSNFSTNWSSSWIKNNSELYAARESTGGKYYYCSKLKFIADEEMVLSSLTLEMDVSRNYGSDLVSAIFCQENDNQESLSGKEVYEKTTINDWQILPEYIYHIEIGLNNDNKTMNWTFIFEQGNQPKLEKDKSYYIYLRRKLGLKNQSALGDNGFMAVYNPDKYPNSYSLKIDYNVDENLPNSDNYILKPEKVTFDQRKETKQLFEIHHKEDEALEDFGTLTWSFKAYNSQNQEVQPEGMSIENGVFSYTPSNDKENLFSGQIIVTVSWGSGAPHLDANIYFPFKWTGLKSWLAGYAMRMVGIPLLNNLPIKYKYKNQEQEILLPPLPIYDIEKYKYACIVKNLLYKSAYDLIVCTHEFIYDGDKEAVNFISNENDIINIGISTIRLTQAEKWSSFKYEDIKEISLEPIWSNKDIKQKDNMEEVKIKTYRPIPLYIQEV